MHAVPRRRGRAPLPGDSLALADGCGDGVGGFSRANAVSNKKEHQRLSDALEVQVDATPPRLLDTNDEKVESKNQGDKLEKEERDENYDDDDDEENEDDEIFTANEEVTHDNGHRNKEESAREDEDGDECLLEYRRRGSSSTSGGDDDEDDEATDEAEGGGGYQSVASEHSDDEGEPGDAPLRTAPADGSRPGGHGEPPSAHASEFNALLTTPLQQPQQQPPPLVATPMPTLQQQQPPRPSQVGYPTVCVSPGGLITVLLKYDVSVEMTLDRTLRVVNHRHKAVAASNARGSVNCLFHVAAKVLQDGTRTEAEVFGERRCRMTTDGILFASGGECYLLDGDHIVPAVYCFSDMSRDCSVNILLAAAAVSTPPQQATAAAEGAAAASAAAASVVAQCEQVAKSARYYFHKNGSTTVILNNVKVHQDERGDVQVTSGPKYICTSPVSGYILLRSHFVDMSAHANWFVSVRRGEHLLRASYTGFAVSNGRHEAGFDPYRAVFSRPFCEVTTGPVPCAGEINMGLPLIVLPQPPPPLVLLPTKLPPQPPPPPTTTVTAQPQSSATASATGIRKMPNRSRFDRNRTQPMAPTAAEATTAGSTKADSTAKGKGKGKSFG